MKPLPLGSPKKIETEGTVMALFISNGVGVNSIEDDAPIPAGWATITEAEAKKANPALFGAPTDEFNRVLGPIPGDDAPAAKASK